MPAEIENDLLPTLKRARQWSYKLEILLLNGAKGRDIYERMQMMAGFAVEEQDKAIAMLEQKLKE